MDRKIYTLTPDNLLPTQEPIAVEIRAQAQRLNVLLHELQAQADRARSLCDDSWRLLKQFPDFNLDQR